MSNGHLGTRVASPRQPIVLRNVEVRDAEAVAAMLSDPRNNEHDASLQKEPMPTDVAARMLGRMRESAAVPTVVGADGRVASGPGRVNMLIVLVGGPAGTEGSREDGVVIGFGGYGDIKTLADPEREGGVVRVGDVGAMINPEHRGKGYGAEAMRLAVEWGFRPLAHGGLQLDRVTATALAENTAVIALIEKKLGWKGVRRASKEAPGHEEMFYEVLPTTWMQS